MEKIGENDGTMLTFLQGDLVMPIDLHETRIFYLLPTKFQEGNVFCCDCPSVSLSHVTITYDGLYLTVQVP